MTPINLVVGFLGAGKTTLINKFVVESSKKIAIIENEFGEVNIDQDILENDESLVYDINDGCLCCSIKGDLIKNLKKILDNSFGVEHLVIEATGVANPGPIIETLIGSEIFNKSFFLNSVICVVDENSWEKIKDGSDQEMIDLFESQLSFSNHVYISKLEQENFEQEVKEYVSGINPLAKVTRNYGLDLFDEGFFEADEFVASLAKKYCPFKSVIHFDVDGEFEIQATKETFGVMVMRSNDLNNSLDEAVKIFDQGRFEEHKVESLISLNRNAVLKIDNDGIDQMSLFLLKDSDILVNGEFQENSEVLGASEVPKGVKSVAVEFEGIVDSKKFELFLNYLSLQYRDQLYRVKGFLTTNEGKKLFQGVFSTFNFSEISRSEDSNKIVFIGKNLREGALREGLLNTLLD